MRNTNIIELAGNLDSAIRELRNRRLYSEADAVKMSKEIVIPLLLEVYEKEKKDADRGAGTED